MNVTTDNPPRIEFPCRYPVKVMGDATAEFRAQVLEIFQRHAPGVSGEDVTARPSTKGNYLALTIVIDATGVDQLENLFAELKTLAAVKLVL